MDPKVLYWTGAWLIMGLVVGLAFFGLAQLRAGRPSQHRTAMITAACLIVAFVVSYALKLHFLGREDLSTWSTAAIWILRFHEMCVLTLVVAGTLSLNWGRQLRVTRNFTSDEGDELAARELRDRHKRAGRATLGGAVLGFFSASFVLAGMYARLP